MRPRNAREREVVKLHSTLPLLTNSQWVWIKDSAIPTRIYTSGHRCWCSKCGQEWQGDLTTETTTCPHCGAKGEVVKSRKTKDKGSLYVQFLHVHKGWQVIRTTAIRWASEKGQKQRVYDLDVFQKWCQPGKPAITLGAELGCNCYYRFIPYSYWGGPLTVKDNYGYYKEWMQVKIYPRMSLLPVYVKNLGRKPNFSVYGASDLLGDIFGCPYLETLYKAGKTQELKVMLQQVNMLNEFWPSVRVALRHGYTPQHWPSYWEHLRALRYLRYDMRSPRYVAPPDFGELHDLVTRQYRNRVEAISRKREETMRLRWAIQQEENERRREKEALSYNPTFAERIEHFADLHIADNDIVISPLMSIEAFRDEGNAMHHCVFSLGYYKKPESLILSARTRADNERVETIEVSLKEFRILQSMGVWNRPTERHEEICSLVNAAMPEIKQMAMTI